MHEMNNILAFKFALRFANNLESKLAQKILGN